MKDSTNIDFTNALPVVSSARKLIFRVPAGDVVDFPEGVTISEYGQNNNNPVIVVRNHVDKSEDPRGSWQGADGKNGIIIMNAVSEPTANELLDIFVSNPTIDGLNAVINRAEALGCVDNYTTSLSFVDEFLSPAGRILNDYTGIFMRGDQDVCLVVRDSKGVIRHKIGNVVRHIDSDYILVRDYVLTNGDKIDPKSIPVV